LKFDEQGQIINGTLADYLLPTAPEVPIIEILHHVTPSPYNELGVKGMGEAGAIPVGRCSPKRSRTRWSCPRAASTSSRSRSTPATCGSLPDEPAAGLGRSTTRPADSGYAMSWLCRPG
jgi:hypothetical protein